MIEQNTEDDPLYLEGWEDGYQGLDKGSDRTDYLDGYMDGAEQRRIEDD